MNLYILNTLTVVALSGICNYKWKGFNRKIISGGKIYSGLIFLAFTFIMGFRALSVGVDTAPYARIFGIITQSKSYIDAMTNAPLTAPLYVFYCKTLGYISTDPQILTIVSAIIINAGLIIFVMRVSERPLISYLVWIGLTLFYCSMNGTRQCMSIVFALNSLVFLSENIKSIKGWMLFLCTVLIHSIGVFIVVAILGIILSDKIKDNKIIFIISIVVSMIISFAYEPSIRLILKFIPRYTMYTTGSSQYSIFNSTGGGRIIFLYIVLLAVVILWMLRKKNIEFENDDFNSKMLPAVLFGAVFGIVNCRNELINRMLWYYMGIYVSFIPSMISNYKKNEGKLISICVLGVLIAYSVLSLHENQNGVVPYIFYWS